jgi:hypothetical protein
MIGDRFMPARVPSSIGVPDIQWMVQKGTPTASIVLGSVLVFASGEVDVDASDPTAIVGIALAPANSAPGYGVQNNPTVHTGRQLKIPVARANRQTVFCGYMTNGSSTKVNPADADVGAEYGITPYSDIWTVDKNKSGGSARVHIVGYDPNINIVFFKFMQAAIAI